MGANCLKLIKEFCEGLVSLSLFSFPCSIALDLYVQHVCPRSVCKPHSVLAILADVVSQTVIVLYLSLSET